MFNLKNKKTDVTTDFYPSMVLFSLHRCDFDELIPVSDVNGSGSHFVSISTSRVVFGGVGEPFFIGMWAGSMARGLKTTGSVVRRALFTVSEVNVAKKLTKTDIRKSKN